MKKRLIKLLTVAMICVMMMSVVGIVASAACLHVRERISCSTNVGTNPGTHYVSMNIGGVPSQVSCSTTAQIRLYTKYCADCNANLGSGAGVCYIYHQRCSTQHLHSH
jgi:hypothetical protein